MTEQLHRLLDNGASQEVINERVAGLFESAIKDIKELARVGSDHEKRIRFIERTVNYGLGAIGLVAIALKIYEAMNK